MEQNTPYNPFAEGVSTAAPDSFQAAIDYLLQGKQQTAATQRQGLFAQPAPVDTPTTSVVKDVFGDRYRSSGSNSNSFDQPFTGNPYSGKGLFGTPTYDDIAKGLARQGELERNRDNLSKAGGFLGGLLGLAIPGAMFAKYAVPFINDQSNDSQYGRYLDDQDARAAQVAATQAALGRQVGTYSDSDGNIGTVSTQKSIDDYDRETFGVTSADLNAARDTGQSIDNSKAGPGSTYGGEGE